MEEVHTLQSLFFEYARIYINYATYVFRIKLRYFDTMFFFFFMFASLEQVTRILILWTGKLEMRFDDKPEF